MLITADCRSTTTVAASPKSKKYEPLVVRIQSLDCPRVGRPNARATKSLMHGTCRTVTRSRKTLRVW
eukprot:5949526-Amphidinium_carterae.1